jgi:hypothetical protein
MDGSSPSLFPNIPGKNKNTHAALEDLSRDNSEDHSFFFFIRPPPPPPPPTTIICTERVE